jgi:hypothetical protein
MGKRRGTYGFWWENHLEGLGVVGRIIIKGIFRKGDGAWPRLIWLGIRTSGGFL